MYETSVAWKANQARPLTREAFVEVSYSISDPDIHIADAADNGSLPSPLSDIEKTVDAFDREIAPYATLEKDLWILDGSKVTLPDEGPFRDSGYISSWISDDAGNFAFPYPSVNIDFSAKVAILPGLTITWGIAHGEFPVAFDVITYDRDGIELQRKSITNNNDIVSIAEFEMKAFWHMKIEIRKWCKGRRRARIAKIYKGVNKIYSKANLLKFSSSQQIDPLSAALPKYEISFAIDNINGDYNPNDEHSLSKYMMERQEIRTRYGFRMENGSIEWIPGGLYFLSDWDAPQNGLSASFKARDLLGFLNGTYFRGCYNPTGSSLYELAEDVLNEANLPFLKNQAPRWVIDLSLNDITTQSPLPICSFAECLQLIANAARCTICFDRNGSLHIAPLESFGDKTGFTISDDNSYSRAEVSLLKPLKCVHVSTYGWQVEETPKKLYDSVLSLEKGENVFIVEYSDPATELELVDVSYGLVSHELYAKSGKLVIVRGDDDPAECSIVITGKVLKSTETIVSVENSDAGETVPLKNILITDTERARDIGGWLRERYANRKNIEVKWRTDPSIDAGDYVTTSNGALSQTARIFATSLDFNGAFQGKSEGMVIA